MDQDLTVEETQAELAGLRTQLDIIDTELLVLVRDRIDICVEIAHVKKQTAIPMMQPGRVQVVHERARAFAEQYGISPDFVRALYDLIMGETMRVEDLVIDAEQSPGESTTGA